MQKMDFSKFKKAKCINLFSEHITLSTGESSYESASLLGRTDQHDMPAFYIALADLASVAEMFGLKICDRVKVSNKSRRYAYDDEDRQEVQDIQNVKVPIYRKMLSPEDECEPEIDRLAAHVDERGLLHILIVSDDGRLEALTYNGPFAVWWAASKKLNPEPEAA